MKNPIHSAQFLAILSLAFAAPLAASEAPVLKTVPIRAQLYHITGAMANSVMLTGRDGTLLVDSGDSVAVGQSIQKAIAETGAKPVDYLINTHRHFDHVNGNAVFGGSGAAIVAHESVRRSLETAPTRSGTPLLPREALPTICFSQDLTLFFDDEIVCLFHPLGDTPGHTSGDIVAYFRNSDVLAVGDLMFSGMYPYIDTQEGGVDGMVTALRKIRGIIREKTVVVPGHGPLTDRRGMGEYADMLESVADSVRALAAEGKSLDEIKAAHPTAQWDATYNKGSVSPDMFVEMVYKTLRATASGPTSGR